MTISTGPIRTEEFDDWFRAMGVPFAGDMTPDQLERARQRHDPDRSMAARDGDRIVATFGSFPFTTTVPGGELPTSGVTAVAVVSTHRRRGILRRLMLEHFSDCRDRLEPLASLWASEAAIYGRFGFGLATRQYDLKLTIRPGMFIGTPSEGYEFRLVEKDAALAEIPALFERERLRRPGMFTRSPGWWSRLLADPADRREGWSSHRRLIASRDGVDVGYALYRAKWNDDDRQIVRLSEAYAVDDSAQRAVWNFLAELDLVDTITNWNDPIDRPFDWWLHNPRLAARKVDDALYLRLVDVQAAMGARSYRVDGTVTIGVTDPVCPWNDSTYRVSSDGGQTSCEVSSGSPEVEIDAAALGTVYLGDRSARDLARVGRVVGDTGAVDLMSQMFAWDVAPYCQEMF